MWFIITGFFLFFVIVLSLWFSKQVTHREELELKARSKARAIKQQISEIEEVCDTLNIYDSNEELLASIYSNIISQIQNVIEIDPSQEHKVLLEHYNSKKSNIKNNLPVKTSIPENDNQINIVKRHLGKTITYLRRLITNGSVNESETTVHINRLKELKIQLEVDAFLMQGEKSEQKSDRLTAVSYYKHAKALLLENEVTIENKKEQAEKITQKITQIFDALDEEENLKTRKKKEEKVESHPLTTLKKEGSHS